MRNIFCVTVPLTLWHFQWIFHKSIILTADLEVFWNCIKYIPPPAPACPHVFGWTHSNGHWTLWHGLILSKSYWPASAQSTVYSVQCTVYSVQCTQRTVYGAECSVYCAQCGLYSKYCTLNHPILCSHYCTVLLQYCTVQYSTVQCSTVLYYTVHYCTVQYSTVQWITVEYPDILSVISSPAMTEPPSLLCTL